MISAERAIRVLRRDLTIASALKVASVAALFVAIAMAPPPASGVLLLLVFLGTGYAAVKATRRAALAGDSTSLIAAGQFDEAEEQIEQTLDAFWSLRSAKLMGLHHLAVLRHAQRRWRESALLSRALLRQRLTGLPGIARTARLMLADSLLELNDLPGAHDALAGLYAHQLTLVEAMNLLVIQLDYEARAGAWESMVRNVGHKVQLAELMPAGPAARAQALLALAAVRTGRRDLAAWLRRRVELLVDVQELVAQRPIVSGLFAGVSAGPAAEGGAPQG